MRANRGRVAAVQALVEVDEGAHAEDALARLSPEGKDRALAWFVALGVLRRRPHVDAALRPHLRQPLESMDADVRAVLRAAAFEKLFARTPVHAVVSQAVEVAREVGAGRAQGLVNAVLRRVEPVPGLSLAEVLDHPAWLVDRWVARYGEAATRAWCEKNAEPSPLTIVARDDSDGVAGPLREAGLTVSPVTLQGETMLGVLRVDGHEGPSTLEGPRLRPPMVASETSLGGEPPRAGSPPSPTIGGRPGPIPSLPGFAEGRFWVQDPASVMVADLVPEDVDRVLDACAAPGGKAFRLASAGMDVLAVDERDERLALLRDSAERLKLRIDTQVHDWTKGPLLAKGAASPRTWPAVLVDAPCTALGTVRRHPEIRWRRQPQDVATAAKRQRAILESVVPHVASGGWLVYAVCSPEPEEGTEQVRAFLADHPDFALDVERTTAPPEGDEDAFYGARLRRY